MKLTALRKLLLILIIPFSSIANESSCFVNARVDSNLSLYTQDDILVSLPQSTSLDLAKEKPGSIFHLQGFCKKSKSQITFKPLSSFVGMKDQTNFLSDYVQPSYDQRLLGVEPTSLRALGFSKQYQEISDSFHGYIGEPKVISSLAFESHVVQDVAKNLKDLEEALSMAEAFRKFGKFDFSSSREVVDGFKSLNSNKISASLIYGLRPFFVNAPWNWGWHHVDQIISELRALHQNMSAMNMHIFSYMTSKESAIEVFFREAKQKGSFFTGRVEFEKDHNGILKEAFYNLFLAAQSDRPLEKKRFSYNFSILLIAYEQIQAQPYYDQIHRQHTILAGQFKVIDPIGRYKLIKRPWSLFQVRFSIDVDNPDLNWDLNQVTPELILGNSLRKGTIPHYYFNRIFHPESLALLEKPALWNQWPEIKSSEDKPSNTLPSNSEATELLAEYGCVGCHRVSNQGGVVGPDLTDISRFLDSNEIESSIVNPEQVISNRCLDGQECPSGVMPNDYGQVIPAGDLKKIVDYLSK